MGTFHTTIEIAAAVEGPFGAIDALVDSGATYTLLPRALLERLGVEVVDSERFVLADGSEQSLDVGTVWLRLQDRVRPSMVVSGPDQAEPLLGAFTLEGFMLAIHPVRKELVRMRGYLVGLTRQDGAP